MRRADLTFFDWTGKDDEYRRLYAEGKSHPQIAAHFGCTSDQSSRHRRTLKLEPRPERGQSTMTEEMQQRIRELARQHYPTAQIARAVGACHETVRKMRLAERLPLWDGAACMPGEVMPPRSSLKMIKQAPVEACTDDRISAGPEPLPPGHPISVAAIGMSYREFVSARAR